MTFKDYQQKAIKTAQYPAVGEHTWVYPALGLVNEAGEVAGKLKKVIRDSDGVVSNEVRTQLTAELGDVLWYVSQIATELTIDLEEVAEGNIAKLASRAERGVLGGSGDNR